MTRRRYWLVVHYSMSGVLGRRMRRWAERRIERAVKRDETFARTGGRKGIVFGQGSLPKIPPAKTPRL